MEANAEVFTEEDIDSYEESSMWIEGLEDLMTLVGKMDLHAISSEWDWYHSRRLKGLGKSLPYWDKSTLEKMQKVGFKLYRDVNVQAGIESLVSYVVYKGWSYGITKRRNQDYMESKLTKLQIAHEQLITDVSIGNLHGWYFLMDESYRRLLRDGEFFRRWWILDGVLEVRFMEVYDILQPGSTKEIVNLESVPPNVLEQFSTTDMNYVPGEFGIVTTENDASTELGFWHRIADDEKLGTRMFEFVSADECQHAKRGVDANDPRGVPAFYDAVCFCVHVDTVNQSMNELAVKQSKYAVIHKHKATNRRESIKDLSTRRAKELNDQVSDRDRSDSETHLKNVDIEMPGGMKAQARNYIEVIQQGQRLIGGIMQIPEFLITNDANTGNRSSLQAAAGPFARRVAREQKHLWFYDMSLQWSAIGQIMGWNRSTLRSVRAKTQISVSFPLSETKDPHKDAKTVIDLRKDGAISRQEQRRMLDKDHDQMSQELDKEGGIEQVEIPKGAVAGSPTSLPSPSASQTK